MNSIINKTEADNELINESYYLKGKEHYASGEFTKARENFGVIRHKNYKDSDQLYKQCTYEYANKYLADGDYLKAISEYKTIADYLDVPAKINEAKYLYCVATQNSPSEETKTYIKELRDIKYKDSVAIANKMFAWKADVSISLDMIGRASFSAKLSGGDGTSTKIKFVISSNGSSDSWSDGEQHKAGDTSSCVQTNMWIDASKTYYSVKVYDQKGNLIGSASGYPGN